MNLSRDLSIRPSINERPGRRERTGVMEFVADIFPRTRPGSGIVSLGLILAVFVTVLVTIQAFSPATFKIASSEDASSAAEQLRILVFSFHVATLAAVGVEALPGFRGRMPPWSTVVIGSGALATIAQAAVVAVAAADAGGDVAAFAWAFATLALQCYADAVLLAMLIAEFWAGNSRTESVQVPLMDEGRFI